MISHELSTISIVCESRPAFGSTFGANNNNPELDQQSNTIQEHTDDSTNEILEGATYTIVQDQLPNLSHMDIHSLHIKRACMVLSLFKQNLGQATTISHYH